MATYGYTAYGNDDDSEYTGIDKPVATDPTREPYNACRFYGKRWDVDSQTYDMGFRDYRPDINRLLQPPFPVGQITRPGHRRPLHAGGEDRTGRAGPRCLVRRDQVHPTRPVGR
ncbi:hypothetical protein BIV24_22740 [Streptomyces colonosanans]|uniref:Uncharacterized protein n=1 Tax=Streptomyces colonosanans TaxID=1428652 RepID=A0A1S2P4L8_9ACTN|nr:hypothetical protein BIV24_22740 [Streptomyces colonosanans]